MADEKHKAEDKQKPKRGPRAPRPTQELVTVAQASIEKGIPAKTLRDFINAGKLPHVRFGDKTQSRIWLRRSDLEAFIDRSVVIAAEAS